MDASRRNMKAGAGRRGSHRDGSTQRDTETVTGRKTGTETSGKTPTETRWRREGQSNMEPEE